MGTFDTSRWENWVSIALLVFGIGIFVNGAWDSGKLPMGGNAQSKLSGGIGMIFIAAILALVARYDSKKKNGSKSKLQDGGSKTALFCISLGTAAGAYAIYRKRKGKGKQTLWPFLSGISLALGTVMALFFSNE